MNKIHGKIRHWINKTRGLSVDDIVVNALFLVFASACVFVAVLIIDLTIQIVRLWW